MASRYSMKDINERRAVARAVVEPILVGKRDGTLRAIYERLAPDPADGRVRTVLLPITSSGRCASHESDIDPYSTNAQNLPKKVAQLDPLYAARDVIVPAPGFVLLCADYRNAEGVLAAAYSQDWPLVEKILQDYDVHTEHARYFFGLQGAPTDLQRTIAKTIFFAGLYKATAETIARNINKDAEITGIRLSIKEVADLQARNLQLHPLELWWDSVEKLLRENNNVLVNALGYRRVFRNPSPTDRLKDALSFYPQSTVATLISRAMNRCMRSVDRPGVRELLLQVHDELVWQVRPDQVETTIRRVTPIMELEFPVHGRRLHVPVEWKFSEESWGAMQKVQLAA